MQVDDEIISREGIALDLSPRSVCTQSIDTYAIRQGSTERSIYQAESTVMKEARDRIRALRH